MPVCDGVQMSTRAHSRVIFSFGHGNRVFIDSFCALIATETRHKHDQIVEQHTIGPCPHDILSNGLH